MSFKPGHWGVTVERSIARRWLGEFPEHGISSRTQTSEWSCTIPREA